MFFFNYRIETRRSKSFRVIFPRPACLSWPVTRKDIQRMFSIPEWKTLIEIEDLKFSKNLKNFFFFFFFPLTALKNSRENGLNFPAVIWNDTFARRITIINKTARLDGKSYQLQWYVDRPIPVLWKKPKYSIFFFFFLENTKNTN